MIYFVYFIIMVAFIDTFAQLPIISPFAKSLGAAPLFIGLAVGMYSFSNIIGNVFAGFWIDRDGPKRVLSIGLAVTGLFLFSYVLVLTPLQLVIVRFLHGLSGGFLVPAVFTYLANRSKEKKKGKSMALTGAVVGLSAVLGPAFGGIVTAGAGIQWVFITIGTLMIVTAVISYFSLPQIRTKISRRLDTNETGKSIFDLLKVRSLAVAYFGAFTLMFSQGVLAYMLPLKVEALEYGSEVSGMLLSAFAVTAILIFLLPTNKLYDRFSYEYTMTCGLFILGISLLLLSPASSQGFMYIIMMVYGVGFALIFPSTNALIIDGTTELDRGKAFGLFYAFFSLGVVVSTLVMGALAVSVNNAFVISSAILFSFGIIIFLIISSAKKRKVIET